MSPEQRLKAARIAFGRRHGASPEARARMEQANAEAADWRATCRHCKQTLKGTLAEVREHRCG